MKITESICHVAKVTETKVEIDINNPPTIALFSDADDFLIFNKIGIKIKPCVDSPIPYTGSSINELVSVDDILGKDRSRFYDRLEMGTVLHELNLHGMAYIKIPVEGDEYPENRKPLLFVSHPNIIDETHWKLIPIEDAKVLLQLRVAQDIASELERF